jgi:ABC transporter
MLSMINGSAQRSIGLTGESMPDRAEVNSAIVQCCTRVVPLRTVNERLNRDAMPDGANWHPPGRACMRHRICLVLMAGALALASLFAIAPMAAAVLVRRIGLFRDLVRGFAAGAPGCRGGARSSAEDVPMITLSKVSKWCPNFQVLKHCSTEVAKGEVVVVCGPSGSGKSTLLSVPLMVLAQSKSSRWSFVGTVFQRKSTAAPRHFKIWSSSSARAVRFSLSFFR